MNYGKEKAASFADELDKVNEKIASGEMTINQARIWFGFKPIEGGDVYLAMESKKISH